jgi:hypothetical protein
MNKPLYGVLLGGFLGIFDGLSALVSAPELRAEIVAIVVGSTIKGVMTGLLIGLFARWVRSLPLGILFGLGVGLAFAYWVAYMQESELGRNYYWQIMTPGGLLGVIVGYLTQRHTPGAVGSASPTTKP